VSPQSLSEPVLPPALKPGDTLGIVAPASPFDRESFDAGLRVLESMDFNLVIPQSIFDKNGYLAGSDRHRADLLNQLFADPDIDGIICARGGYGAMRILPLLDVDAISSHPKVFVGFSDITVLLDFLVQRCHMVAFHGPTVTTLGKADPSARDRFLLALSKPEPLSLSAVSSRHFNFIRNASPLCRGNSGLVALLLCGSVKAVISFLSTATVRQVAAHYHQRFLLEPTTSTLILATIFHLKPSMPMW